MLIKVCGMRQDENVRQVAALGVDMIGFIFYSGSPRYVCGAAPQTPSGIARVGVFVNESIEKIEEIASVNDLSHLQLHGSESVEMCRELRRRWQIIKAFPILSADDFAAAAEYEGSCDLLLFDTKTKQHGGSGVSFDWTLLEEYRGQTPFLLSGGVSLADVHKIRQITHPKFIGVDLNSRFEIEPALKDVELLNQFKQTLKQ